MESNTSAVSNTSAWSAADALIVAGVALDSLGVTLLWGVRVALVFVGLALIVAGGLKARAE